MRYNAFQRGISASNPIANLFVIVVGALAIGASIIVGFFAFIIVGSIVLVMASAISLRVWWLRRNMSGRQPSASKTDDKKSGDVLEGEYEVVADRREGE